MRALPLDEQIACDVFYCELMMVLGHHAPYAAKNLTHPMRKGYYREAERRLVAMHEVLYATTVDEIAHFVEHEKVRYFVYSTNSVKKLDARMYRPARDLIAKVHARGGASPRLLADPPAAAIVLRDRDKVLLDLEKLVEAARPP